MKVSDDQINRARREIDPKIKSFIRPIITFLIKRLTGAMEIGEGFHFGFPVSLPRLGSVRIGRYVYIGKDGSMYGPVVIGDMCMISTHVHFAGADHRIDVVGGPARLELPETERLCTIIEADCWIGKGSTIMEGVTIGRSSVVGAGAVVTKSVPPYTVVAGVPARVIRSRFSQKDQERHDAAVFGLPLKASL